RVETLKDKNTHPPLPQLCLLNRKHTPWTALSLVLRKTSFVFPYELIFVFSSTKKFNCPTPTHAGQFLAQHQLLSVTWNYFVLFRIVAPLEHHRQPSTTGLAPDY